jgi:3-phosphoglycerate kinase
MLNKKTVRDIEVKGKRVLVRCDFNVPFDREDPNKITSDNRIVESLKTINYLVNAGAKVILCSHLGKTGQDLSLKPVAIRLSELLNKNVLLIKDILSSESKEIVNNMESGDVVLLENTRMYKEEEANGLEFSKSLASFGEIFVNDAFGSSHRAHASTVGVTKYVPSVCGFLIEKELLALGKGIDEPARPLVAIVGGAKVSSKIGIIENFLDKVDTLLIGGGMAYTFLKTQGMQIGKSICEDDKLDIAKDILQKAKEKNVKLMLPVDLVVADEISATAHSQIVNIDNIPENLTGVDIGPETTKMYIEEIKKAGTVIWNGPVGVFEFEAFANGTKDIAYAIADSKAISIIGGGDSAAAIEKYGLSDKVTHLSTGGGASLEFMEGKILPAIAALDDKVIQD